MATLPTGVVVAYHVTSILVPLIIIYTSVPGSSLFSWHPTLMSLGVGFLMSNAILIFNPQFKFFGLTNKFSKLTVHWMLQCAAVASMWLAFTAIYYNKEGAEKPHFTTWHGTLGWKALIILPCVVVGGIIVKYRIEFPPFIYTNQIRWIHQWAATVVFILCYITFFLGLCSTWATDNISFAVLSAVRVMLVFMAGVVIYIANDKYLWRRPVVVVR